ncbi:MAG: hypothetical protein JW908_00975 [Anaerolineales bacterium]|nr:hypothetical protein [Anaerolineales bacterium]
MPSVIDPQTINTDDLPCIWSPVQWELNPEEHAQELEEQATASLLWTADAPEAILRLLLNESKIERTFAPPDGYDAEKQGEWDVSLVTFNFQRKIYLLKEERGPDRLYLEYEVDNLGQWAINIEPENVSIFRI